MAGIEQRSDNPEKAPLLPKRLERTISDELNEAIKQSEKVAPVNNSNEAKSRKSYNFFQLFRYADKLDILLMVGGAILALLQGASIPIGLWYNAPVINTMIRFEKCPNPRPSFNHTVMNNETSRGEAHYTPFHTLAHPDENHQFGNKTYPNVFDVVWPMTIDVALIGLGVFIAGVIHGTAWTVAGQRQILRIRTQLFRSILNKNIYWFNKQQTGELNNILFEMTKKMEDGMSSKVSMTISWLSIGIGGFTTPLVIDWRVSIVVILLAPLLFVVSTIMIRVIRGYSSKQMTSYGKAGSIAGEVIGNWKTVVAFNKQEHEVERYGSQLEICKKMGMRKMILSGVAQGFKHLIIYSMAAVTFWLGLQRHQEFEAGTLLVIYVCIQNASTAVGNALPNFVVFTTATSAADEVFGIIDEASSIENMSEDGGRPDNFSSDIHLNDITFCYPERPDKNILNSLSLTIPHGKTVALVGASGSGKSTIAQLLLRLYDPTKGEITLADMDLRSLNVTWLRQNIGLVNQEPVLFNATIRENICLGAVHRNFITEQEISEACTMANAHDFIMKLPMGYDTMVGERGRELSGGQKQRIAIARALIANPKILILDEATSALDTRSEAVVQDALDKASRGRTTIIIAHRLSTIRNADTIVVLEGGSVVEMGSHDELLKLGGSYSKLLEAQLRGGQTADDEEGTGEDLPYSDFTSHEEVGGLRRRSTKKLAVTKSSPISSTDHGLSDVAVRGTTGRFEAVKLALEWGKEDMKLIIICGIVSMLVGAIEPCFNIFLSELVTSFCPYGLLAKVKMTVVVVFCLGISEAGLTVLQYYLYGSVAEKLTDKLRRRILGKVLRMDAYWHDRKENQSSALTAILAADCLDIQGVSIIKIGSSIAITVVIGISVIYSMILDWRIALALMPILPLTVISGIAYTRVFVGIAQEDEKTSKECAAIAMDAIGNMRTVITLSAESHFLERYSSRYLVLRDKKYHSGFLASIIQSLMFATVFWSRAIVYCLGSYLLSRHETGVFDVICTFMLIGLCGYTTGKHSGVVPDEDRARQAAANISRILSYTNTIDLEDDEGESSMAKALIARQLLDRQCSGRIEFRNVGFNYPNRPSADVLKGINLTVQPGQFVALCGPSGSGKSTIIQLLERLYDPVNGSILIDDVDARSLNVRWLRANIGLVQQEPALFGLSIKENIGYGSKTDKMPSDEEIERASKMANAFEFIDIFPERFNTQVGERGALLSGGQKQRIAIARAIVRRPKIMLLDEATSALDSESERLVQAALDMARKGRTCLVIAHRLSTIQNADVIVVIENGRVVEQGTHNELMQHQGTYFNMQSGHSNAS